MVPESITSFWHSSERISMVVSHHSPRNTSSRNPIQLLTIGFFAGFLVSSLASLAASNDPSSKVSILSSTSITSPSPADNLSYQGWKSIHVYIGNANEKHIVDASTIPKDYFRNSHWFSQLRQDLVVSTLLYGKRNGYFIDLAANDAIRISNTYALERNLGWNGLCLEPNPAYWAGLAFRKCKVVAAVAGKKTGQEMKFKFPKRAAPKGGLIGPDFDNKIESLSSEEQMRFTIKLEDIFAHFQTPSVIDYFSLDIEGAETFVMESFPFDRYRFNILTVERADPKLSALLQSKGYEHLKKLRHWGETLWVHSTARNEMNMQALEIDTENYRYKEVILRK